MLRKGQWRSSLLSAEAWQDEFFGLLNQGVSETEALAKTADQIERKKQLNLTMSVSTQLAMLRAFSIECQLKSMHYERELQRHGHVSKYKQIGWVYDLNKLAQGLSSSMSKAQEAGLSSLNRVVTLGRYPTTTLMRRNRKPAQIIFATANIESHPGRDEALRVFFEQQRENVVRG